MHRLLSRNEGTMHREGRKAALTYRAAFYSTNLHLMPMGMAGRRVLKHILRELRAGRMQLTALIE